MKPCVILNPIAGSAKQADEIRKQIDDVLAPFVVFVTHGAGDASVFARQAIANGCDYIIAAGGDGTLNEVINGVAEAAPDIRVGLLPLGTGNDFARSLNLPPTVGENIAILSVANTRRIDLVRVRSDQVRYFVNVSAGGFSGLVDEKLTPEMKRTWGPLAYVRSAAAALPEMHAYRTDVHLAEGEDLGLDLYNVIVANGRFVAGGLPVAPEADPGDGLLDVIFIPKRSTAEMVMLAAQIVLGNHLRSESILFRRTSRLSVRSQPGMWFNADGELVGNEPATFEIIPGALQFVVP
ncbi:MAG TPA: diacylglycerol kinase family protein [Chthoniobacterales bacterium]|nr:diacylglycerol kinase family protein [Chthoniobacterales bacterium]